MIDEERKAIEYYNSKEYSFSVDMDIEEFKKAFGIEETEEDTFEKHQIRFETLLNLIKKQQKEIEELKNGNIDFWISDKEIETRIKNKFISKDKIKAKIEELKAIADNGANAVRFAMTHEDEIERIQKQKDIGTMVEILQSLLEKE